MSFYHHLEWYSLLFINTNTTCSGITSTNGMLVFCAIGKGLRKVDLKDENIVEIVAFAADFWSPAFDNNRLCSFPSGDITMTLAGIAQTT
jgi:hypothetical protein